MLNMGRKSKVNRSKNQITARIIKLNDHIGCGIHAVGVVASAACHGINAKSTVQPIGAVTTQQRVSTSTTQQIIMTKAAIEGVITF